MDKYALLVLMLAPGFIASYIAQMCTNFPDRKSEFGHVARYFSYSFFSLGVAAIMLFAVYWLAGEMAPGTRLEDAALTLCTLGGMAIALPVSVLSAVLVGTAWSIWLKPCTLRFISGHLLPGDKCSYLENTMREDLFLDGWHFVSLERDGKEIAVGFVEAISSIDSALNELSITECQDYKEWLEAIRQQGDEAKYRKRCYLDTTNNIIIREYDYPDSWNE